MKRFLIILAAASACLTSLGGEYEDFIAAEKAKLKEQMSAATAKKPVSKPKVAAAVPLKASGNESQGERLEKTVVTVDQLGRLNVAGIASVTDVATNAVKVQIAEAKAAAASSTAHSVTNALNGIVQNIMDNNTVIYRYGFTDSFSALIIITDSDQLWISDFQHEINGTTLTAHLKYVCTAQIQAVKPIVYANSQLDIGKDNFPIVDDANVTAPVYHAEPITFKDMTYDGWYDITVTIPNLTANKSYFFWIKIDPDTPSGDGMSLALPNGVQGGQSTEVVWGDKRLTFFKGMLMGVENVGD